MTRSDFSLTVLGTRGSMAACRPDCLLFGGDTTCYMIQAGEETVFLDGGSGIVSAPASYRKPPVILLSHLHLDHVMGLAMFPALINRDQKIFLYVPFCRDAAEAEQQMDRLFSPPFWPVKLKELEADVEILPMPESMEIRELHVDTIRGNHPNGCMVFRLRYQGKTIVCATDYEYTEASFSELTDFAKDADLLLFDAQFLDEEYASRKGFGHSTPGKALELMRNSGAKRLLMIHHAPQCTDKILLQREKSLPPFCAYARQGQVIQL